MFEGKFETTTAGEIVTIAYDDKDAFKKAAEEAGLNMSTLKSVSDFNAAYIEEATVKGSELAKTTLLKNKAASKVIVTYPYSVSARGKIDVSVNRERVFNGMHGGEKVTKSTLSVMVDDPHSKVAKSHIRKLEEALTNALLK